MFLTSISFILFSCKLSLVFPPLNTSGLLAFWVAWQHQYTHWIFQNVSSPRRNSGDLNSQSLVLLLTVLSFLKEKAQLEILLDPFKYCSVEHFESRFSVILWSTFRLKLWINGKRHWEIFSNCFQVYEQSWWVELSRSTQAVAESILPAVLWSQGSAPDACLDNRKLTSKARGLTWRWHLA